MHGNDRLGPGRDRIGELRHVHAEVVGAVDEHGPGANVGDGPDRGNERVRGGDDFVAGPNADRLEAEAQRIRSRVDAYGVATTHQLGEARLEFFDRFAQRVVAGGDDFSQPRKDRLRIVELFRQIGERDPHVGYLSSRERRLPLQVSAMLARQAFSMSCRVG